MPGSARQTAGIAFTQCIAVATMPGLRTSPAAIDSGCRPWKVVFTDGSPVISTSKRSPSGPNLQAGSRCSLAHQPVDARRDDRLAAHRRLPAEALRRDAPRRDRADRRIDRRGRDRHLVGRRALADRAAKPSAVGEHVDRLQEAAAEQLQHRAAPRPAPASSRTASRRGSRRARRRCGCRRTPRRARG